MSVKDPCEEYNEMLPKWRRCRDASDGQDAIHCGVEKYLPRLAMEPDEEYRARVARSPFFNATWRTIAGLRGMMTRKPAAFEWPAAMGDMLKDADMAGTPIAGVVDEAIEEALTVGRIGLMVDHPERPEGVETITVATAERLGLRPSLKIYETEHCINWRESIVNNARVLSMVVLTEEHEIAGGDEFHPKCETRYRVLDLFQGAYRQRLFRINDKGDDEQIGGDVFPTMNGQVMSEIPFVFVGVDCLDPDPDEPPLIDMVNANITHYRVGSDYHHGLHLSVPTLFISGAQPDSKTPIYIGSSSANYLARPEAKAYYVEVGSDFRAHRQALEDLKNEMAVLGARMLEAQKAGVEAADTAAIHRKGEESQLSNMSKTLSAGFTRALGWFAEWGRFSGNVRYELSSEFGLLALSAQDRTSIVASWIAGATSHEYVFNRLKAAGEYPDNATWAEEQARIGNSGPATPTGGGAA